MIDIETDLRNQGVVQAIERDDPVPVFNWLLSSFGYQGISDTVASGFALKHGSASWQQIDAELSRRPSCPRLRNYWRFAKCGYNKTSAHCNELAHIDNCPLPRHPLRNGRLNQTAYSFYLFVRDFANGNFLRWLDERLSLDLTLETALLAPLRHVHGISDKILMMSLSSLLLCAPTAKPHWFTMGKDMVAVDSLVHNFFHRTGILDHFGANHLYGPHCYRPGSCANIIRDASAQIDAREFNTAFPVDFPRFVQNAIWRYCAGEHFNMCNGNRIDDRKACSLSYCQVGSLCGREPLNALKTAI